MTRIRLDVTELELDALDDVLSYYLMAAWPTGGFGGYPSDSERETFVHAQRLAEKVERKRTHPMVTSTQYPTTTERKFPL